LNFTNAPKSDIKGTYIYNSTYSGKRTYWTEEVSECIILFLCYFGGGGKMNFYGYVYVDEEVNANIGIFP
jgi:hypothetical protein